MKKSKVIKLVLVAGIAASCSSHNNDYETSSRLHIRGDSTSSYTNAHSYMGYGYYHFIPYGFYSGRNYYHGGYESSAFSSRAISRSGFGRSGIRVGG